MKTVFLVISVALNVALVALFLFLNGRYNLLQKAQRVAVIEGRVPGVTQRHEMNRNYAARRAMFAMDRNNSARVLFLGDSQVALADWNALMGEPLIANRGIEGDTTVGVLARLGDDADFRGDTVAVWIGTNDVLHGETGEEIAERIVDAVKKLANSEWRMAKGGEGSSEWRREEEWQMATGEGAMPDEEWRRAKGEERRAEGGGRRAKREVVVLSVVPFARWVERAAERNLVVAEVNERLAAAAKDKNFVFVDLDPVLWDGLGYLRADMTWDGVHLNAAAYAEIVKMLKKEIGGG